MANNIQLLGSKVKKDRTGITTISERWLCDTIEEAIDLLQSSESKYGLEQAEGDADQQPDGRYEAVIVYEGLRAEGGGGGGGGPGGGGRPAALPPQVEVTFDGSNQSVPFPRHPKFRELSEKYGWDAEKGEFSAAGLPPGGTGPQLGLAGAAGAFVSSPLAGESSFILEGGTLSIKYARTSVPARALQNIGAIDEPSVSLPGVSFRGRNFRKLAPRITKRGSAFQIEERYAMSGIIPWPEDVYSLPQLNRG